MNKAIIETIASYGNRYREKYLLNEVDLSIMENWWAGLDFFFSRACFQGRRDTVSERVYQAVRETLMPVFSLENGREHYKTLREKDWQPIREELNERIGEGKVGKRGDVMMVISTLNYIGNIEGFNITRDSVAQIRDGKTGEHYKKLQGTQRGIYQVGPKIAAFYLRDLVCLCGLEDMVQFEPCLQPIDTWVAKLAVRLGIVDNTQNHSEIQTAIASLCQEYDISAVLFNQGAWYISSQAFEVVIDMLLTQV